VLVKLSFLGILSEYTGCRETTIELGPTATVGELITRVGEAFAAALPAQVWDQAERRFTPLVGVFVNRQDADDPSRPLSEGDEVIFLTMIAGG